MAPTMESKTKITTWKQHRLTEVCRLCTAGLTLSHRHGRLTALLCNAHQELRSPDVHVTELPRGHRGQLARADLDCFN